MVWRLKRHQNRWSVIPGKKMRYETSKNYLGHGQMILALGLFHIPWPTCQHIYVNTYIHIGCPRSNIAKRIGCNFTRVHFWSNVDKVKMCFKSGKKVLGNIIKLSRFHHSCKQNLYVIKSPKIHLFAQFYIWVTVCIGTTRIAWKYRAPFSSICCKTFFEIIKRI